MKTPSLCMCALLLASATVVACGTSEAPRRLVPTSIAVVGGGDQSGVVGRELSQPLVIEVTDAGGRPVPGQLIQFRVTSGGGSVFAGGAMTNAAGRAQERWTLGTRTSEAQRIEARAVDADTGAALFATFSATPLADAPAAMVIASGDGQTGIAGAALGATLAVRVEDRYGNPDPAVVVTWVVEDGGGTLEAAATVTDPAGLATNVWAPGRLAVIQHARAELVGLSVRFSTGSVGGFPVGLTKASGDGLTSMAGKPVFHPPVVRVTDALGAPVAGVDVQFVVTVGGGEISAGVARTDAEGKASCGGWTLGSAVGENRLVGSVSGVGDVVFSATGALPSAVTVFAGNSQWATPGADVAIPPSVRVWAGGALLGGAPVQFSVTAGGGQVGTAVAVTDGDGLASCDRWTLGPSTDLNRVAASVEGVPAVTFVAYAGHRTPGKFWIELRTASTRVGDPFAVQAAVYSNNPVVSVSGTIGLGVLAFVKGPDPSSPWDATFPAAGRFGPTVVIVTATDSLGEHADAFLEVVVDRKPTITVGRPVLGAVGRPSLEVDATCSDDDPSGCAGIDVVGGAAWDYEETGTDVACRDLGRTYGSTAVVATGPARFVGAIDLSAFDGHAVALCFVGRDTSGQRSRGEYRLIYVESSTRLSAIATVPGTVLDASGSRTLFVTPDGETLRLRDETTGVTETLHSATPQFPVPGSYWVGFLAPSGAVHAVQASGSPRVGYVWRDGTEHELGPLYTLDVAGQYAAFAHQTRGLVRRDLRSGAEIVVAAVGASKLDVASDGDVVYGIEDSSGNRIFSYSDGVTTQFAGGYDPQTDGTTLVYLKIGGLTVNDGSREVVLPGAQRYGYLLADGWVAFDRLLDQVEFCRRGPSGVEVLAPSPRRVPEAIAPDGTVVFRRRPDPPPIPKPMNPQPDYGRRHRARPGEAPEDIGSGLGRAVFRDGRFLVLIGGSVFEISP